MPIFNFLNDYKTYIAAAGLVGLAVYNVSIGSYPAAWANLVAAFGLFSAKQASQRVDAKLNVQMSQLRGTGRLP